MAAALLREISQDEHERARQRSRKMWEMDMYTAKEEAKEQGHEEGFAEGRAEGHAEGITEGRMKGKAETKEEDRKYFLSLLDQGLPVEEIKQRLAHMT